jgi:hypothetical protein
MTFDTVLRTLTMVLAGGVALVGILIATGVMANGMVAAQQRIVLGAVVFLYGTYRLTVAYFRRQRRRDL